MSALTVPRVAIIVLNWNGLEDTLECLDSVFRLDYPNYEVIVVDNCSSDGSVATIRREFPQVTFIENSKNLGYTGGNNVGIRRALNLGADYVWLLNNDTVVEPDTVSKLVDEAERSPETGLVSPVIHLYDTPEKIQFRGTYADFANYALVHVKDAKELESERVRRNLILWGTALFIKKNVIEAIGYLSEKYFAYHEDCEYSLRALRNNFRTLVRLDSRVFHKESRSTGKRSPIQVFLRARNVYFLWMDNVQGVRRVFIPCHYIGMMIRYAKVLSDEGDEGVLDACLNGMWAALRGIEGAYDPTFVIPARLKTIFSFFLAWHPYFWANFFMGNLRGILRDALARTQRI